jgi:hypothetical protein
MRNVPVGASPLSRLFLLEAVPCKTGPQRIKGLCHLFFVMACYMCIGHNHWSYSENCAAESIAQPRGSPRRRRRQSRGGTGKSKAGFGSLVYESAGEKHVRQAQAKQAMIASAARRGTSPSARHAAPPCLSAPISRRPNCATRPHTPLPPSPAAAAAAAAAAASAALRSSRSKSSPAATSARPPAPPHPRHLTRVTRRMSRDFTGYVSRDARNVPWRAS